MNCHHGLGGVNMEGKEIEHSSERSPLKKKDDIRNWVAHTLKGAAIAVALFQLLNVFDDFQFGFSLGILLVFVGLIIYKPEPCPYERKQKLKKRIKRVHLIFIGFNSSIFYR